MSNNIARLRKEYKLTQADLASYLNTTTTNIGYYELEKRDIKTSLLHTLSHLFMVSIDYLLGASDSGIKIHYEGLDIIEFIIKEDMLEKLIELGAVYYKDDDFKRYLDIHTLLGLPKSQDLDSLMESLNTLDDLNVIESFPLSSKDDLDKLYSIIKIKSLDNEKAHTIKKLLELI